MVYFTATALIGWIMMVILPVLAGEPPLANVAFLAVGSVVSLIVWRVAEGSGGRVTPGPTRPETTGSRADPAVRSSNADVLLPNDWSSVLASRGLDAEALHDLLHRAYTKDSYLPAEVFPERQRVFRALNLTPLDSVKVVVIGQDPYPTPGHADGLAFSVRPGMRIPYSLSRVFSNLESDSAVCFSRPQSGDLTRWARQGVLLLNAALTTREHAPNSHRRIWDAFTRRVLEAVNDKTDPVVFLLWGDDANHLADSLPINEARHRVIRSTHPRREEDSQYRRFSETRPFSEANSFLRSHGRREVDWTL